MPNTDRKKSKERPQCHVVSNTHWDREWKQSANQMRHMLVHAVDVLLDVFAREAEYGSFHFDSQTIPLVDYLEIRPEREADVRRHVESGRLTVGPWYCLPDEFCVNGESLIRNLLLGHRIARRLGGVCKTGYSPFSWGQISQMPQIYRGFGIDVMMFYRGVNTRVAPRSEFIWKGPDGSSIIASRLGARPRYNVWYVLQRPAYWAARLDALNDFSLDWSCGHVPFRMVDHEHATLEYRLAHPRYQYDTNVIPQAARQAIEEQDEDWSTPHRLWAIGHDASCPDVREAQMVEDAKRALADDADVFFSSIEAFQDAIRDSRRSDWPVVTGEMRHTYTKGSTSALLGWIISARTYLKQDNHRAELALISQAEPMAVFASFLGAVFPRSFIDRAYAFLLQNHAHDSIAGCGRDIVHDDMQYRFRCVREHSASLVEQAMMNVAGSVDTSAWSADDLALVIHNLTPQTRDEVVKLTLDVPTDWPEFEILNTEGVICGRQEGAVNANHQESVHNPNDVLAYITANRHELWLDASGLPPMGYTTYRVRRSDHRAGGEELGPATDGRTLSNEYLTVKVNRNGSLNVVDKHSGRRWPELGYFLDSGAAGNPWQHEAPQNDTTVTTLEEVARVSSVRTGELESSVRVEMEWMLPAALSDDRVSRSAERSPVRIVNTVTLRRYQPWVDIVTELENTARDHYLRVCFPTAVASDTVNVQSSFDVVTRPIGTADAADFDDVPQTEQPMHAFVDISDGRGGVALLNEGLKAYEACDDPYRTINLTLLRCFAMRFFVPEKFDHESLSIGSQCLGKHRFRYAFMPHRGDWCEGDVWSAAERFTSPLLAAQIGVSAHGTGPLTRSFVEIKPQGCAVSAVKQSESGEGWIVRLFNPYPGAFNGAIRVNDGEAQAVSPATPTQHVAAEYVLPVRSRKPWRVVRSVTLEELPEREMQPDVDGWIGLSIPSRKIVTLEFLA